MVYLDTMPLRFGHFRVLITTAMGQFLGAAVATLSGVLIPLLAIVQHHELDSVTQGLIASMELIGIMVGSFVIGKLADKDGYLPFLRLSSILVFIGALVVYVSGSIDLLIPSVFVMGFGIGGDFVISLKYANGLRNGANSDTHRCKQLTEHGEERCIKLREVAGFSAVRTIFQIVGPRKILHCLLGK